MQLLIFALILTCLPLVAHAKTCEESFQKKGDFLNGSAFSAQVQLEGMSIEKLFSKLRPILARDGIKTLSTDLESGILKAENPATPFQRALPIDVYATVNDNLLNVEMIFTLPSGVTANKNTTRSHLCGALNQLLPTNK